MYRTREDTVQSPELGCYRTYNLETESGLLFCDFTTEFVRACAFVRKLNTLDASELHICDLMDDFLAEL